MPGIKREWIVPYNAQYNGITERKNKSIVEASKAMIHDLDLPMFLWKKASTTIVYVKSKRPHSILGHKTPERPFTRIKPKDSGLRISSCPVYIHWPKKKRKKLETSGKKGTFVGYNKTSQAYKIYILKLCQIEVSQYVTFDEEIAFGSSRESHMEIDIEEQEAPKHVGIKPSSPVVHPLDYQEDSTEPTELVNLPRDVAETRKRLTRPGDTLQDAKRHASPTGTFRESRKPQRFSSYMALIGRIIDFEHSNYEEATGE